MARPGIPKAKRRAIVDALRDRAGTCSRNGIAREFKVGAATVTKIAQEEDLLHVFDRSGTVKGTRARVVDSASRRAQLSSDLLDDVEFFRGKFRQDWMKTVVVPGIGPETVEADSAEIATGLQRLMTSVGIAIDKHVALEKHDSGDNGAEDAKSMLLGVADGLRTLYVASGMSDGQPSGEDAPAEESNT